MDKISICGRKNCLNNNNNNNTFDKCEDFFESRLQFFGVENLNYLYQSLLNEFGLDNIQSSTIINGKGAQESLFERLVFELFGCRNFADYVNDLNILNSNIGFDSYILKSKIQSRIKKILY